MKKIIVFKGINENRIIRPVLILATVLIVLVMMNATGFAKIESLWFVFPLSGIRISTVATAFACFAIVLFMQRRNTLKSVYYAILAVIVPMAIFETLWYYSAAYFDGADLRIMQFAALFGWILLGLITIFHYRLPKISIILYSLFVILFTVWLATGFKYNDLGDSSFSLSAESINVISKGVLFFAYAFHIGSIGLNSKTLR